ncbi:replication initiation factor domain-containing protein [Lactococcus garvieae]|uniref:replication initiation factor domain-containing protein n=1 Tax=Lactococcus garvieae TaxID=1363 RepID=UPI00254CAF56|nr:replication initiation factor domain-containing protein [Lactococcus garvieae]
MPQSDRQLNRQSNLSAHVDWLNFRIDNISVHDLTDFLKIPIDLFLSQTDNLAGYQFYDTSLTFSDLKIYSGKFPNKENSEVEHSSVYAWFSGQACQYIEDVVLKRLEIKDWREFFIALNDRFNNTVQYRRIDLNIDDQVSTGEAYFKPYDLLKYVESERFCYGNSTNYSVQGTDKSGMTLYLGAKTSSKQIRIYDKKAERLNKLVETGEIMDAWTRTEIQFLRESAEAIIEQYLNTDLSLLDLIKGYLKSNVHFYTSNSWKEEESPKEFRPWVRFLGKSSPIHIHTSRRETPLIKKFQWLDDGGSLAIMKAYLLLEAENLLPEELDGRMGLGFNGIIEDKGLPLDLAKKIISYLVENNREDLVETIRRQTYDPFKKEKDRLKYLAQKKKMEDENGKCNL